MKTLTDKVLYHCGNEVRHFVSLFERAYEFNDKVRRYFCVSRFETLVGHKHKKPDAVVIVAVVPGEPNRIVVTSEHRIVIGAREFGFPAGLIESHDFDETGNISEAAIKAAVREFKEETGMDLEVIEVSPANLYSSSGLTDESIIYVMGNATGMPSKEFLEETEDIDTKIVTSEELKAILEDNTHGLAFSKTSWPFLREFINHGKLW